ncbi:MAG TPA: hypothetical protein VGC62_08010 [Pseudomonas sp.]|uniref:hypothetical protein n=1 Tax=Pseudomonas sp. TaxID=306 RepID=UPI002ED79FD8
MDDLQITLELICELLSKVSFELSARLKQRLNLALIQRGLAPLDERRYNCRKFSDFLQTQLADKIILQRPDSSGDIRVSIKRETTPPRTWSSPGEQRSEQDRAIIFRSDVWQAFINPDGTRKRYFNRLTHQVLHFVEGCGDSYQQKLEDRPGDYLGIEWVPVATHKQWMAGFLDLIQLSDAERGPLQVLIDSDYSSNLNAAFTKALGAREQEWRKMRTLKINQWIQAWTVKNNVSMDDLIMRSFDREQASTPSIPATREPDQVMTPRDQATRLLGLMSDDEIIKIAIPALLGSVLSRSQL